MCNVQSKKAIKKVHVVVWGKAEKAAKGKAKEQAKKGKRRPGQQRRRREQPQPHESIVQLCLWHWKQTPWGACHRPMRSTTAGFIVLYVAWSAMRRNPKRLGLCVMFVEPR